MKINLNRPQLNNSVSGDIGILGMTGVPEHENRYLWNVLDEESGNKISHVILVLFKNYENKSK